MFGGRRYWEHQLRETDRIIEQTIGVRPAMFRPPMGIKTPYVMRVAAQSGQAVVTWNRRAMDGIPTTPQRILDRLGPRTAAGDVLLLHDGVEPNSRRNPAATIATLRINPIPAKGQPFSSKPSRAHRQAKLMAVT